MVLFFYLYYSEAKRQFFLIKNFDIDKSLPDNYLRDHLSNGTEQSKKLYDKVVQLNNEHLLVLRSKKSYYYYIKHCCYKLTIIG